MTKRRVSKEKSYPYSLQADILLARVLELPPRQQLRIHEVLQEVLGEEHLGEETEQAKQVRARAQAVQAMRRAAAYLGLPEGRAPFSQEYRRAVASREANIGMSLHAVRAAFDNRWELARDYYEGVRIPLTAAQRRVKRTKKSGRADPVTCLRLWWEETSPPRDAPASDYNDWAVQRNQRRAEGEKRVLESTSNLLRRLEVSWEEAVALAAGAKTLDEAQRATQEARLREAGPLLAHRTVRDVLAMPNGVPFPNDMPNPVTKLYGQALWRTDDICAYKDGQRDFTHPEDAELGAYVDEEYVARALGIDVPLLRQRLSAGPTGAYTRVPPPAGRLRSWRKRPRPYWRQDDIERQVETLRRRTWNKRKVPLAFRT